MGNTDPNNTKQENKYEVKPQYKELSKQLIMQHAIIDAMKCMRAIKDWIARPVYQLAIISVKPLYHAQPISRWNHRSVIIGARQPITARWYLTTDTSFPFDKTSRQRNNRYLTTETNSNHQALHLQKNTQNDTVPTKQNDAAVIHQLTTDISCEATKKMVTDSSTVRSSQQQPQRNTTSANQNDNTSHTSANLIKALCYNRSIQSKYDVANSLLTDITKRYHSETSEMQQLVFHGTTAYHALATIPPRDPTVELLSPNSKLHREVGRITRGPTSIASHRYPRRRSRLLESSQSTPLYALKSPRITETISPKIIINLRVIFVARSVLASRASGLFKVSITIRPASIPISRGDGQLVD
ncbi:myosin-9 [Dorcoceras hygrometricum]|uniref:Myosin-9 n=1 Tax=Dorcoceras hygrometricum TaxID=472368 RepID=A0A2Z7BRA1_9LAMI|nr:myosin-9 [Dorcoceras hygrometricum]